MIAPIGAYGTKENQVIHQLWSGTRNQGPMTPSKRGKLWSYGVYTANIYS